MDATTILRVQGEWENRGMEMKVAITLLCKV